MSNREAILAAIRAARGVAAVPPGTAVPVLPARARGTPAELVVRFVDMALFAAATVAHVGDEAAVPAAVADFMARTGLGDAPVLSADPSIAGLPWAAAGLDARAAPARPGPRAAVTAAVAGVAETGTLLVAAGGPVANALHFLPEAHLCVLHARRIVGGYEDAWRLLRADGADVPPRAVTFVTGPSRTADIEKTPQIGVHGPRMLHIVLVGDG